MGPSLVAVTHGRGLFTATPGTEPADAGDHLADAGADHATARALGATQLNATTTVPGTFVYTPAAGTRAARRDAVSTLSVTFTPTDTRQLHDGHGERARSTSLKATPVITWPTPADIVYGTALSATQLNATTHGAGHVRLHAGRPARSCRSAPGRRCR